MAIIQYYPQLNSAIGTMLQGLAFWMGYSKCMNELYEHDCVHQAFAILRANLGKDKYAIEYEYPYVLLDKRIKTQERADLVILKKTPRRKTPLCVMEFKMSDNTNGGVAADVKKLRHISNDISKLVVLLFYNDDKKLCKIFTTGQGNAIVARKTPVVLKGIDKTVRVRRVAKAMATAANPKRSPYMAVCIDAS